MLATTEPPPLWRLGRHPTLGELSAATRTDMKVLLAPDLLIRWGGRSKKAFINALREHNIGVTEDAERLIRSDSFTTSGVAHSSPFGILNIAEQCTHDVILAFALLLKERGTLADFISVGTAPILDEYGISRTFLITGDGPSIRLQPACD